VGIKQLDQLGEVRERPRKTVDSTMRNKRISRRTKITGITTSAQDISIIRATVVTNIT